MPASKRGSRFGGTKHSRCAAAPNVPQNRPASFKKYCRAGIGFFRLKRIAWAGLGSLKIGNQHNMQYNPASFPTVPKPPQNAFLSVSVQILISPVFRFQAA